MAEAIVDEIRARGDKWAVGMMLVLMGSVRLWTGRALAAIPSLEEAQGLFGDIDDHFGAVQAGAVLGRALVVTGQLEAGFATLPMIQEPVDEEALSLPDARIALVASAAAAVQIGDTDRAGQLLSHVPAPFEDGDDVLLVADAERAVTTGLYRLQLGQVDGAVDVLQRLHDQVAPELNTNLASALALALAVQGEAEEALALAARVDDHERASYLDRIVAGLARAVAHARRGDHAASVAAFDQVEAAADATDDLVSRAITRLADALAASARGEADAAERLAEVDGRLRELGLEDTAWRRAFSLGLGISSPA
jgi:tetratricopeptide (TPR) repeat protein